MLLNDHTMTSVSSRLVESLSKPTALEAARHICQETRIVLTSLRGGPPAVARGELAQDLMDLRLLVKASIEQGSARRTKLDDTVNKPTRDEQIAYEQIMEDAVMVQHPVEDSPIPVSKICNFVVDGSTGLMVSSQTIGGPLLQHPQEVGQFARPFLAVVMDPRAAGPHTLVALRVLFRLMERGSLCTSSCDSHNYIFSLEPLMRGVLACKFEQTDAGADEAVEMAIADLLALLVRINISLIHPVTLMEAFNTVFVTRNTFVHSPALCYHFEDVLSSMVTEVFTNLDKDERAARLILEFLVNQLLHTPLTGGDTLDEAAREAQMAHDATRVLCLRLTRICLRAGWKDKIVVVTAEDLELHPEERSLLRIIQDDLCLSLLMTGQAIWAHAPGFISVEVLSEICGTLSTLWNTISLRNLLVSQFETIFTGFYQRALVLLCKRVIPMDSIIFHQNLVFDAELEVILESLVDLLYLHERENGACLLETLYATFDCHLSRSDVAEQLVMELSRACGGIVDDEGNVQLELVSNPQGGGSIWRPVPPHLKELCAECLVASIKCLFKEENASEVILAERARRRSTFFTMPLELSSLADLPAEMDTSGCIPSNHGKSTASITYSASDQGKLSHRTIKSKKRLMRKAAKLFNQNASVGIGFMVTSGLILEPITPLAVASFLRNGLVVGLDKQSVGAYLGELGKSPVAGKSPPSWERDWFHKEVLITYCSLFKFERQSLLDGLRMFLAAFRLPGESQQIDRIIQAFADSCGQLCEENVRLKVFSEDPKRAGDAAFLLAFSIIMLNTDLHSLHIREDRKMTLDAFIRNNADYGADITDKGKEFPPAFLTSIYESIREEEIKTIADGAEGHMTVERWKDVLRGSSVEPITPLIAEPSSDDVDDLKELMVQNMWKPIMSSVGAFWGVTRSDDITFAVGSHGSENIPNGMLGAQGARIGMDLALELLAGVRSLGRVDIFREVFLCICRYTGLLDNYFADAVDRTAAFVDSVEAQSAVIVVMQIARDAGDEVGIDGWKRVWGIIFELRDLKMLGGGRSNKMRSILMESDADFLSEEERRDRTMWLMKGDNGRGKNISRTQNSSFLGGLGRALFGLSERSESEQRFRVIDNGGLESNDAVSTPHGKEDLLLWDDLAASDDEDDVTGDEDEDDETILGFDRIVKDRATMTRFGSAGASFESQLIHENFLIHHQTEAPVTGLERVEDSRPYQLSPRARVRKRLMKSCDFVGLICESRFMDILGVNNLLTALLELIDHASQSNVDVNEVDSDQHLRVGELKLPLSPASEAMAEVLICEIAVRNKDRLGLLWETKLKDHYTKRLLALSSPLGMDVKRGQSSPGIEKCVTGLLRISACAVARESVANELLGSLTLLYPSSTDNRTVAPQLLGLDRHLGEGLWRICRHVDGLSQLNVDGWGGLLGLAEWCATRGGRAVQVSTRVTDHSAVLAEDDPALQTYRSIHLMLHARELQTSVPFTVTQSIKALLVSGEVGACPKLCMAALDLLHVLHNRLEVLISKADTDKSIQGASGGDGDLWVDCWIPVLEGIADAVQHSSDPVSSFFDV